MNKAQLKRNVLRELQKQGFSLKESVEQLAVLLIEGAVNLEEIDSFNLIKVAQYFGFSGSTQELRIMIDSKITSIQDVDIEIDPDWMSPHPQRICSSLEISSCF